MNNVALVGRLTKDPELRYTQTGKAVANFNVAVNRPFKNANGEREADFINVVQFSKGAELTAEYMKKGSQVGVSGRIQSRNYKNNEGKRVFVVEIVADQVAFLESKNKGSQGNYNQSNTNTPNPKQNNAQGSENANKNTFQNNGEPIDINDQDLPF